MEQVFFTAAIACFALAIVAVIVAIFVFVRGDVANAIRFLRHKPTKSRGAGERAKTRVRADRAQKAGQAAASLAAADGETDDIGRATGNADAATAVVGRPQAVVPDAESATDVLDGDQTEHPTDILVEEGSEQPTGLLAEDESERPTGILSEEDSEQPTTILGEEASEEPTGLLVEEASEQPTGVLPDEDSEQPTTILDSVSPSPDKAGVAQQDEPGFRFILRRNEVVVHTDEVIE